MMSFSDEEEEISAIVIDNGACRVRAGFAGDDAPRVVFPTLTATPRHEFIVSGMEMEEHYVGDEAERKSRILSLHCPLQRGVVTDWEQMTHLWRHTYDQLRVAPEEQPVLITETPRNPKLSREKMTEVMFEEFGVPAFYLAAQGILSTYASGRGTVIVLDVGEGQTHVMNIYEGNVSVAISF